MNKARCPHCGQEIAIFKDSMGGYMFFGFHQRRDQDKTLKPCPGSYLNFEVINPAQDPSDPLPMA